MQKANMSFLKIKDQYLNFIKQQEVMGEPFQDKIGQLNNFYIPISDFIYKKHKKNKKTLIIGLAGGQGSGKSTIAKILKIILKKKYKLNVINFSIDDYYKTLKDRKLMSKKINKLFLIRGVPGTHDIDLIKNHLNILKKKFLTKIKIPKFDKSKDDRVSKNKWIKINKKQDIVIFEGWCVGATSQNDKILKKPINNLEKFEDDKFTWRKKVNNELKTRYKKTFNLIDIFIFLQVPSFKHVYKWRLLQEKKLKIKSKGKKIMNNSQIKNFIMYYERITKNMIKIFSRKANIVIKLDKKHRLNQLKFN
jgi:D-glycerate 3-kinase